MKLIKGVGEYFALDIGTKAIRVVQLSGSRGSWTLTHYGYAQINAKVAEGDSAEAKRRLGEIIMAAVGSSGIKTRNVVVGVSSQKSFTTVIDVPNMPENELRSTIKYQIDKYIPMSIDEAKVDWAQLGQSMHDRSQQEVLLASTAKSYVEGQLEFLENLGFNVIALEPEAISLSRAILPAGIADARILLDIGENSTNLVVTFADAPRLVRNIPTGLSTLIKATAQSLNVQEDQARQFILKFGLDESKLEGQVVKSLDSVLDTFAGEITKSIKFFQTRYPEVQVGGLLATGFAVQVPLLSDYLKNKTGVEVQAANPWQSVSVSQADQQQLSTVSSEFAVAVGLAQRGGDV